MTLRLVNEEIISQTITSSFKIRQLLRRNEKIPKLFDTFGTFVRSKGKSAESTFKEPYLEAVKGFAEGLNQLRKSHR